MLFHMEEPRRYAFGVEPAADRFPGIELNCSEVDGMGEEPFVGGVIARWKAAFRECFIEARAEMMNEGCLDEVDAIHAPKRGRTDSPLQQLGRILIVAGL